MTHLKLALTAGFAIFSMFFGSGNLVFPIIVGTESNGSSGYASIGLILTAVLTPALGLLAMLYAQGQRSRFFADLPKWVSFSIVLTMLLLLGPIGVVPRCTVVAQGGMMLLDPRIDKTVLNAVFLSLILLIAWQREKTIDIIAKLLTPILLGGLSLIIIFGFLKNVNPPIIDLHSTNSFLVGLKQGYQTMDLLAAFFFSATIVQYILKKSHATTTHLKREKIALSACLIGCILLALVYISFVHLGAKYAFFLKNIPEEKRLVMIAHMALGKEALPIVAMVIFLACLTTATILALLFANFVNEHLPTHKNCEIPILILTLTVSFFVSLNGFGPLANFLAAALSLIYPALIAYSLAFIIKQKLSLNFIKPVFYISLALTFFIKALRFF